MQLIFEDNGKGIPGDILHAISTPFYTTKEDGVGTGLGLSIIEDIVKSHNGFIHYESQESHFTRVIIEIPFGS